MHCRYANHVLHIVWRLQVLAVRHREGAGGLLISCTAPYLRAQHVVICVLAVLSFRYWLYATVRARDGGLLVSNDELRDHIWSLLRPKHFLKWKVRRGRRGQGRRGQQVKDK